MLIPDGGVLAALRAEARLIAPGLETAGIARADASGRVSVAYTYPFGLGEFLLPADALPATVAPGTTGRQSADAAALPPGPFEAFLRQGSVRTLAAVDLTLDRTAGRLWIGTTEATPLDGGQWDRLDAVAATATARLTAEEPVARTLDRLRRLDLAAALLPAMLQALDVRQVFDQLSDTTRRALPHDLLMLRLFSGDLTQITVYARSDRGSTTHTLPNAYPASMVRAWAFDIVDDLARHPYEANQPTTALGARSSLRLPIRIGDDVVGGLAILSFTPAAFTTADVPVARRLAEHVAVGLAHHRLAEEGRQAAALRARADSLDMLDGLLDTLTGVLDVREVFARVSAVTRDVLPHDGLSILEVRDGGTRARVHASHGLGELTTPHDVPLPVPALAPEGHEVRIIDDYRDRPEYAAGPGVRAGMRSSLFVTIRLDGATWGGVNFYSRTPGRYSAADAHVARRVADHIALALSHSRLADQVRITEELRARATSLDLVDQLLAAIPDDGELAEVIDRVSDITGRVLAHDATVLAVYLPDGEHMQRYVSSAGWDAGTAPAVVELPEEMRGDDWDHIVVDDLSNRSTAGVAAAVQLGFRAALCVAIRLEGRIAAAFVFLSRRLAAFTAADVAVGRRVADRIALRLSRDRGFEAMRRADEATERAARLEARVRALTDELDARTGYRRVVGESKPWRQVLTQATQVAATETTALLLGESGTGKEVVARFVHRASPRGGGPFVALNCAALPEQLLEAELFGYERGAFTGATQSKPGQLEQAAGGTLFLDEVGEMSPSAQAKFLRVLQEREFQRLGGTRVLRSEARVVAATNRDLPKAIANGQFREDLYYRLNVFAIRLPALRDRPEDILPLAEAFLTEIGRGLGRPPGGITKDAREALLAYRWPGNVRELRNVLERAAILCEGGLITAEYLGLTVVPPPVVTSAAPAGAASGAGASAAGEAAAATAVPPVAMAPPSSAEDLASIEKAMIETALQTARFNKSKAAKALGMTRHQLYIRMRKHGLE